MKIIHVVLGKANPDRMNGVNKVAYYLCRTQDEMGHQVELWGIAGNTEKNYPPRQFRTRLFQQEKWKWNWPRYLKAAVKEQDPDTVFHFHGAFIPEFALLAGYLRRQKRPYVYTPHGALTIGAMQQSSLRKRIYLHLIEARLIRKAKAVQLLGIQEFEYLDKLVKGANKVLIPNGQNLSELEVGELPSSKIFAMGFCGRLDRYHKGLDLMLQAFAEYKQQGYPGRLELIGGGKDEQYLKDLSRKLGLSGEVIFHGPMYGMEKFKMMGRFDLFLHTSRMEGFPMAVLEASGLGVPSLTSPATNFNDYLLMYDAGYPMQENSTENIVAAMKQAAADYYNGRLESKGSQARLMAERSFNWEFIAGKLIRLYHEEQRA